MLYFYFMFLEFYIQIFHFSQDFYFVCKGSSIQFNKVFRVEEASRDKSSTTSFFPWLKESVRVVHSQHFSFPPIFVLHLLCLSAIPYVYLSEVSEQDTLVTICHRFYFHCTALVAKLFISEGFIQ